MTKEELEKHVVHTQTIYGEKMEWVKADIARQLIADYAEKYEHNNPAGANVFPDLNDISKDQI